MRRIHITLFAAGLCIGLAGISSTVAYVADTETMANRFSFVGEDGIDAILTEPGWDPENGLELIPNESVVKDPQVTNTSSIDLDILAALQVEFIYSEMNSDETKRGKALTEEDMAYVCSVYEIDWNADEAGDWVRYAGESAREQTQHFYYSYVLKRNYPGSGDTTVPLFTEISIPKNVNSEQYSHIQEIGGFDIRISGAIVQQMTGETEFGLDSALLAYESGLFEFSER